MNILRIIVNFSTLTQTELQMRVQAAIGEQDTVLLRHLRHSGWIVAYPEHTPNLDQSCDLGFSET
jgi:hypothetical protein